MPSAKPTAEKLFLIYAVAERTKTVGGHFYRGPDPAKNVGEKCVELFLIDVALCPDREEDQWSLAESYNGRSRERVESAYPGHRGGESEDGSNFWLESQTLLVDYDTMRPVWHVIHGEAMEAMDFQAGFDEAIPGKLAALLAARAIGEGAAAGARAERKPTL